MYCVMGYYKVMLRSEIELYVILWFDFINIMSERSKLKRIFKLLF